ncbi:MAG: HAD-IA family hydrolase [Magnetococcus sp. YQC-5]
MFPIFSLVIFDCDGTLVDSLDGIARSANQALSELGYQKTFTHAQIAQVVGLSLDEAMLVLLPEATPEFRREAIRGYKSHYQRMADQGELTAPLFPGARETLTALHRGGVTLAVATGKSLKGLQRTLQEHDLSHLFSVLMTADQAPSKPHPAMVENILDAVGLPARHCLMVGDTLYDLEMGRHAGVKTAAVTYGCHSREQLAGGGPDYWLESLTDVLPVVGISSVERLEQTCHDFAHQMG